MALFDWNNDVVDPMTHWGSLDDDRTYYLRGVAPLLPLPRLRPRCVSPCSSSSSSSCCSKDVDEEKPVMYRLLPRSRQKRRRYRCHDDASSATSVRM